MGLSQNKRNNTEMCTHIEEDPNWTELAISKLTQRKQLEVCETSFTFTQLVVAVISVVRVIQSGEHMWW